MYSLSSGGQGADRPSRYSREEFFLDFCVSFSSWCSLACGCVAPFSASLFTWLLSEPERMLLPGAGREEGRLHTQRALGLILGFPGPEAQGKDCFSVKAEKILRLAFVSKTRLSECTFCRNVHLPESFSSAWCFLSQEGRRGGSWRESAPRHTGSSLPGAPFPALPHS